MADTRINALSTATSSASDDFVPIDGTTNGTRKLSAFSPSFGGNATVGGTLTVSGATMSVGGGSGSIISVLDGTAGNYKLHLFRSGGVDRWYCGLQAATETGSNAGAPFGITALSDAGAQIDVPLQITRAAGGAVTIVRPTAITNTTASTSTSSGALVVGNGTDGGLGVGGTINAGQAISTTQFGYTGQLTSNALAFTRNSFNYVYLSGGSSASLNFQATTTTANDTSVFSYNNTRVAILTTTASTGTSSGALVVSGGVGVAKRIFTGEGLDTAGDNATHISFVRNGTISIGPTSAATPKLQVSGGVLLANTLQSIPAWGDVGPQFSVAGAVVTDTSSSGTVSRAVINSIASTAIAASSTTTYTQAATLFIAAAPTANTNVTITHGYALYIAGGRINFQGLPTSATGLQAGTLWNDGGTLKVA